MWLYEQLTGNLFDGNHNLVGKGYSGADYGKNNPEWQSVKDVGPIPQGDYIIGKPYDSESHGPFVLPLTPAPANEMYGRAGFLMHGDSLLDPGHASEGCVIQSRDVREQVATSNDEMLRVVSGDIQ